MQYLLMDTHRRLLGTLNSQKELAVGDTFQADSTGTYAVIGLDWNGLERPQAHSLTVIPVHPLHGTSRAAAGR